MSAAHLTPETQGPYLVYRNRDIFLHDYVHHKGSIEELKAKCETTPDCIGFNSLGYFKTHWTDHSLLTEMRGCDFYLRPDRLQGQVERTVRNLVGRKLDLTFVMTTCKRLNLAIDTLDHFLRCCSDSHLVSRWLVIDDASSKADIKAMRRKYPFLDVIQKPPERKGHPQSLNWMMELVKTRYVLLFEDDWRCCLPFSIQNYLDLMERGGYDQISLLGRDPSDYFKQAAMLHGSAVYEYAFDPTHPDRGGTQLKETYSRYLKEFGLEPVDGTVWQRKGYYYPGFSLNPGIFDLAKLTGWGLRFEGRSGTPRQFRALLRLPVSEAWVEAVLYQHPDPPYWDRA